MATSDAALTVVNSGAPTIYGPVSRGMVRPVVLPDEARLAIKEYEALKEAILQPSDLYAPRSGKPFVKRSGWRRIARAFGISCELVREDRVVEDDDNIRYTVIYRAVAPNGQYMDGDGMCTTKEFGHSEHDTRAKAHTRAKNRAISDLVGGGEVSADELHEFDEDLAPRQSHTSPATAQSTRQARTAWNPIGDANFRKAIATLGYVTVEQAETFVAEAKTRGEPNLKEQCLALYAEKKDAIDSTIVDATVASESHDLSEPGTFGQRGE